MRLPRRRMLATAVALIVPAASIQAQAPSPDPNVASSIVRAEEVNPGSFAGAPAPVGFESDLYCFGYLGDPSESFVAEVTGAQDMAEQLDFSTRDFLYLNAGADRDLKIGDEFWIVTPEHMVVSPVTGKDLGRFYKYRGRGVVHSIGGRSAIFVVKDACTDIPLGAFLKTFEPIPIPLARKSPPAVAGDPPSGKPRGHIVEARDGLVALGQDNDVIVDLGVANSVEPGDFLTIFRYSTGREYGIQPQGGYWVSTPPPPGVEVPRTYLGEIAVLAVGDRWAIGRIVDAYQMILVGDEVEVK
jgi:hypothetical protein